jgi:small subunit ribosomal protein S1
VHGKVTSIEDFGVYVSLEENIEGFVHISELSEKYINKPDEVVTVGQELDLKVIKVNPKDKKIELSLKGYAVDKEKQEIHQFISSQEKDVMTLGDIAPHLKNNHK